MATYKGTSHITMWPMKALLAMDLNDLVGMAKVVVTKSEDAKVLQKDNKASVSALGKVIAAMKRKFNDLGLASALTFPEFWETKTGTKKVNNHAESCGKCYGLFVDNALITESDYDANPADNLQKAAAIATKCEGDLSREEVLKAADILKVRHKDAAKQLQTILDRLNGPKKIDGETAKEQIALIFQSGLHVLVFAALGAEIHHETDRAKLQIYSEHTGLLVDAIAKAGVAAPARPVLPPPPAAPAEPAAPALPAAEPAPAPEPATPDFAGWLTEKFGSLEGTDLTEAVNDLTAFYGKNERFPNDENEFFAFVDEIRGTAATQPA